MDDERSAGPEEQEEARSLAEALAGQGEVDLGPDRSEAVLARIMEQAGPALDDRARDEARGWLRWGLPVGGLTLASATAALLLLFWPVGPAVLPAPDAELLRVQAQAVLPGPDRSLALRRSMRSYRGRMFQALDERYRGGS
ncbi:MAG: hypothetical protein JRF33_07970 [Deltaproteobacteria bacterium]|nr:hypothetical protein [Deltaproteobacteria bacterium]